MDIRPPTRLEHGGRQLSWQFHEARTDCRLHALRQLAPVHAVYYQSTMRRSFHLLPIAHAILALTACKAEDCEPGFAEGEQFRFTVLAATEPECDHCSGEYPQLAPGDTFILEGGTRFESGHSACNVTRGAKGAPPPRWSEVVTDCGGVDSQLGQECSLSDDCGGLVKFHIRADIREGQPIDDGELRIKWSRPPCGEEPPVGCTQTYPVSIERL
jgi:hypothetical protein